MLIQLASILSLVLTTTFAWSAFAQDSVTDGVLINARNMDRDLRKRTVKLEGDVQVVFQGQHLSCDTATIDLKTQTITAKGNVILTSERVHVEGSKVVFNYKKNTGWIYDGFVKAGQVVFEGEVVEKIGENHYLASNGRYTACETCPPGWSFSGKRIDAELGGYARIKRPVFRIAGVPVMMLPSIIVPLKSARQSGFLVPTFDYSKRGGAALAQSYFWAINKSEDATFAAKWYDRRGFKGLGEYRYVAAEGSRGKMNGAWMQDREVKNKYGFTTERERWFLDYGHIYQLPGQYTHRLNFNRLSDLRYPTDFPDELSGHGDPAIENKTSISSRTEDQFYSAEVDIYTNLLKRSPTANNDDAVHRAPEIRYSLKETKLGRNGPLFRLDMDYVNLARNKHNYDDLEYSNNLLKPIGDNGNSGDLNDGLGPGGEIERDGKYSPDTDLFRTGQRVNIQPGLSYPFHLGKTFDVAPSIHYRESQYRFYPTNTAEENGFGSTAAQRYLQTDLKMRMEAHRVFGNQMDPLASRWKHSVEPEMGYSHIPWIRQANHPFFRDTSGNYQSPQYSRQFDPISDADIASPTSKLQFDYRDRIYDKQLVDFAITNRLTRKSWGNSQVGYNTIALFRLSQSYDFNEAKTPTPHAWSPINGLLDLRFDNVETNTTASYNTYAGTTNIASRLKLLVTPSNYFQLTYNRNFVLTDDYEVAQDGETRNIGFGIGFVSRYVDGIGQVDYNYSKDKTWELKAWSYGLDIKPPGRCWVIRLKHAQIVQGDPQIGASINFNFGGDQSI